MKPDILIADDEPGIRKVLAISLRDSGYTVFTAPDGNTALGIFREKSPGIILLDIRMPGIDGMEVLAAVKRESPDTEVIMMTGHGEMDLAVKSLQLDACDFIAKPVRDDFLNVALKRAEQRISLRKALDDYTKNLERMVEEKTSRLLMAEKRAAVGETVAGLSHTIRNLAGGLNGGLFVLQKGIELENREYLDKGWEMVRGNARRMSSLSLDLINYAKAQHVCYEICDPARPAREVFASMESRAERCGVTLKFMEDRFLSRLSMDAEGIRLSLTNLLTNALDACMAVNDGRKPEISLAVLMAKDGFLEYVVSDNGCGMDEETAKRLFSGFFTTKGVNGTGMGLMLTKSIVERHGGALDFSSDPGRGSVFRMRIPGADFKAG